MRLLLTAFIKVASKALDLVPLRFFELSSVYEFL